MCICNLPCGGKACRSGGRDVEKSGVSSYASDRTAEQRNLFPFLELVIKHHHNRNEKKGKVEEKSEN